MQMPDLVECPSREVGKWVTVSKPKRGHSAWVAMNHELGELVDCYLPEHLEKDWNMQAICLPLGGGKWLYP